MRAATALLGLAAGDVLGVGVEGASEAEATAALDRLPIGGGWSDDTQQALVVARHLLVHGDVDSVALGAELGARDLPHRGIGPGFARFLASGLPQPSAGNGAAMRAAPIGVRFRARDVIEHAAAAGMVTHADPRGVAAGVAVAVAVARAAEGSGGADLLHDVAEDVTDAEHRLFSDHGLRFGPGDGWHTISDAIRAAVVDVALLPHDLAAAVGARAAASSAAASRSGTHPYSAASVVTALALAAGAADPVGAVRAAVSLGGDADTVAAIVGAIVAVRFEVDAWPWEVPKAGLLLEIGRRLVSGEGARGIPPTAELVE